MSRARPVFLLSAAVLPSLCTAATSALERQTYFDAQQWQRNADLLFQALPTWSITVNLLAATILFAVWRQQRGLTHFTWLFGASLLGNAWTLPMVVPAPLPALALQAGLLGWFYCLVRILTPEPNAAEQRALRILFPLGLLMYGAGQTFAIPHAADLLTALYSLLLLLATTVRWRQLRNPASTLLLAVCLLAASGCVDAGIHFLDWHLPGFPEQVPSLMPVAQIVAVMLVLSFLVTRHAENQTALVQLNASLDQRVQAAEAELDTRYRNMTRDALDAAAMRERGQIYESIHEDLSDKLLQLIYGASNPETADLARAALAELRDSRRLQADSKRALPEVLADLYAECQTRCELASLPLDWTWADDVKTLRLNARQESALSRSLREALSNLLKHAQATHVSIQFERTPDTLRYHVHDDGVGMGAGESRGRGLLNMRQRLQELGGSLRVDSSNAGTTLHFEFPVQ